ncbi:hypothetical protein [Paenibacillus solani]|uniref:hypothetical protein n=1 Tax=Paenibacillus solani TaxID=1705565 RepID=UPI003D2C0746
MNNDHQGHEDARFGVTEKKPLAERLLPARLCPSYLVVARCEQAKAGSARYRLMKHLAWSAFCVLQDGIRVVPRAHSSLGANVLFLRPGRFIHGYKKEYEEDAAKPIIDDNDA